MKNEKQIVLFLKKNSNFNQTQIAAKINEKFIELGNPIILPINNKDLSQPLIIFNQGIINLTMNYNEVSFVLLEENYDKCFETMIEIIELLQYFSMDFVRLGYISTFIGEIKLRQRVGFCGDFQLCIFDMCINLSGVQIFMSKHFLNSLHINASGKHHGSSSMAQFVSRKLGGIQTCLQKCLFYQTMDCLNTDPIAVSGAEKRSVVRQYFLISFVQISIQSFPACRTKVHKTLFISFSHNTNPILINI